MRPFIRPALSCLQEKRQAVRRMRRQYCKAAVLHAIILTDPKRRDYLLVSGANITLTDRYITHTHTRICSHICAHMFIHLHTEILSFPLFMIVMHLCSTPLLLLLIQCHVSPPLLSFPLDFNESHSHLLCLSYYFIVIEASLTIFIS